MKLKDIISKLEALKYEIGNFRRSKFYDENKEEELKVGIYARRSKSDKKAMKNQIDSVKYIVRDDFNVDIENVRIYEDNGVSGTNINRSAYCNLKRDLKLKKINVIVIANLDRLGRTTEVLLNDLYPNQGIEYLVISIDDQLINAIGNRELILNRVTDADNYAALIGNKSRRGLKGKMKSGSVISSKPLWGYNILDDGEKRKYVLGDPIAIKTIQDIFYMYAQGLSLGEIVNKLNNNNIRTPSKKNKWGKSTVVSILENPLYTGELYQGRHEKQGYSYSGESRKIVKVQEDEWIFGGKFEGIIDKSLFNMVQKKLKENKSTRSKSSERKLFSGILKCGDSGHTLVYRKRTNSYQCSSTLKAPYHCTSHLIYEHELKEIINNKIYNIINTSISSEMVNNVNVKIEKSNNNKSLNKNLEDIELEIKDNIKHITKMIKSEEKYIDMIIEEFRDQIKELEFKKTDILQRINENNEYANKMKSFLDNANKYSIESNNVYRLFIKEIRVYEESKIEILWRY